MLSLRVKTVRAAAHISLFVVVPLLLLVQLFHETFLVGLFIPAVTLLVSLALSVLTAILSMRKFVSM
jgi:hypothetical protein